MTKKGGLMTLRHCDKKCNFRFPILNRNLLVGIRLCKSLNWNSISLVLFVQLGAMKLKPETVFTVSRTFFILYPYKYVQKLTLQ